MGSIMENANITVRVSILDSAAGGGVVYSEIHKTGTNKFGLFNISIGRGIQPSGLFANIDWATGSKWMQLEIQQYEQGVFTLIGMSELLSVPYALYAGSAQVVGVDRDSQQLSLIGNSLSISNGNTVNLSNIGSDNQSLSLSGNIISISNGNSIDLTSFLDNTDDQTLNYSSGILSISRGNSVVIPDSVNDADANPTNELQYLSISNDTLFLTNGGFVKLPQETKTGLAFKAYANPSNSHPLTNYSWNQMIFEAEEFDDSAAYNNSTGMFTAPKSGVYFFEAKVQLNDIVGFCSNDAASICLRNVSTGIDLDCAVRNMDNTTTGAYLHVTSIAKLNQNDQVQVRVWKNYLCTTLPHPNNIIGTSAYNNFSGYLIR